MQLTVRALLTAALLLSASACGPVHVIPAFGSQVETFWCFSTQGTPEPGDLHSGGIHVYRGERAKCPSVQGVEADQRLIEERYGVSIAGKLYLVAAEVECGHHGRRLGCTANGDTMTVTDNVTARRVIRHEMAHVAHLKSGATAWWLDPDLRETVLQQWRSESEQRYRGWW